LTAEVGDYAAVTVEFFVAELLQPFDYNWRHTSLAHPRRGVLREHRNCHFDGSREFREIMSPLLAIFIRLGAHPFCSLLGQVSLADFLWHLA